MSESSTATATPTSGGYLNALGAYGFEAIETILLAALVTEDPLLLIGRSGTGKTFLLNTLSEALGLEHRHYNASLISFDDLVGFPYPDDEREKVRFLQTPATIWGAESVLVDEISRCKPEHQNRLFSLVHERRVQGIELSKLRYRWAAMNPCGVDQGDAEDYLGSEALDPALADRFALIVNVGDWAQLGQDDRRRIADPSGEGVVANDRGQLAKQVRAWRAQFEAELAACPDVIIDYACVAASALLEARVRLSPRRVRLLTRSLLATSIVAGEASEIVFESALRHSLPHLAWGQEIDEEVVLAAHRMAWSTTLASPEERWLHQFHLHSKLDEKAKWLLEGCPSPDTGSIAIEELLANEAPARAAAFALAATPAAVAGWLPLGAEAVADLGRLAEGFLAVDGEIRWRERLSEKGTHHPGLVEVGRVLRRQVGARAERARQLLYGCLVEKLPLEDPRELEMEFNRCVKVFAKAARQ